MFWSADNLMLNHNDTIYNEFPLCGYFLIKLKIIKKII